MTLVAEPPALSVEPLLERVRGYNPAADLDVIRRAYDAAYAAHAGQCRDSGAPYIEHPMQVTQILADLQMDVPTLAAGLLHDVVEDTSVGLPVIESQFGGEIARLVDGVTKLSQAEFSQQALAAALPDSLVALTPRQSEEQRRRAANIRKIFLAMANDVRVMIVKLADRLHNMQTLDDLPPDRQRRIASETLQIFAPLAHRLGIWHFKWQLEDLAFKHLEPEQYKELVEKVQRTRREREEEVQLAITMLRDRLKAEGIEAEIQGRPKHLYSIWNKVKKQEITYEQVFDLVAVRIIVNTIPECYHVLGLVHELWLPIPGLFSDHIAQPRSNMYQSLHTKVIGPRGEPIEIQIRTFEMHRTADFGVAAHWQYKEGGRPDRRFEEKLTFLRQQLFNWQSDSQSDTDFLRAVVEDLFVDQVFVFTPHGDVIDLPAGSVPIDFAYRIHSDLGSHCVGAKVNGRMVPLTYRFKNGDIVEILSRPSAQPSPDWLGLVKTSHAKSRIRAWMRRQRHAEHVARGREMLERELQRLGLDPKEWLKSEKLAAVAKAMNYAQEEDLLAGIGFGYVPATTAVHKMGAHEPPPKEVITGRPVAEAKLSISAGGVDDVYLRRSRCCDPLPGEEVIGYVTRGKGMAIHRRGCPNIARSLEEERDRIVEVAWRQEGNEKHAVRLRVETVDRVGQLTDLAAVFSELHVNIEKADIRSLPNRTALWNLVVDVADLQELEGVVRVLNARQDVLSVQRIGGPARPAVPS
jgi:GTP pyrophosphokinase